MTEITKLLDNRAEEEYNRLMFGENFSGGLHALLPAWLEFDDTAVECIVCIVILRRCYDIADISMGELYSLYCRTMEFIHTMYALRLSGDVLTKKTFLRFLVTYPQIMKTPSASPEMQED